jgi:predicted dehydrogenase
MSGEVFHAPLLAAHKGFELRKIVQRTKDTASARNPGVAIVRSPDDIIHDDAIELVIVNTPNDTHAEYARQALKAGKHVVIEKPFTISRREAAQLIALARTRKKILSVFHNRRWDGSFLTVQHVLRSNVLGKVVEFESHYDRFRSAITTGSWKEQAGPGTGILYNLGSHMLDQVLVLFGKPKYVTAKVGVQRPGGKADDYYDIRLEYPGMNVIVKSSYLVREPSPIFRINGVQGSFVKYGQDPQEEALKQGIVPGSEGWGTEPESWWGKLNIDMGGIPVEGKIETVPGNYMAFYNNIFDAVRKDKALMVKPEQAMLVIQLIEAALKSSATRRSIKF